MLQADSSRNRALQPLLTRAIRGFQQGVVTVETVASIRGIVASEAKDELDAAGLVPKTAKPEFLRAEDLPAVESDRAFLEALDALDGPV